MKDSLLDIPIELRSIIIEYTLKAIPYAPIADASTSGWKNFLRLSQVSREVRRLAIDVFLKKRIMSLMVHCGDLKLPCGGGVRLVREIIGSPFFSHVTRLELDLSLMRFVATDFRAQSWLSLKSSHVFRKVTILYRPIDFKGRYYDFFRRRDELKVVKKATALAFLTAHLLDVRTAELEVLVSHDDGEDKDQMLKHIAYMKEIMVVASEPEVPGKMVQ